MFMRQSPGATVDRRRGWLLVVAIIFGLYLVASAVATVWTDYLWFDSLGYVGVWWTRSVVRAALTIGIVSLSFLVLFSNLALADRMSFRHLSAPGSDRWRGPRARSGARCTPTSREPGNRSRGS